MALCIRPASGADSPLAVEIVKSVYDEYGFSWDPGDYHADLYDIEAHYLRQGHFFWLAELDGQVVGTAALEIFPAVPGNPGEIAEFEGSLRIAGSDCALQRLYVKPDSRRSGVGSALLAQVVQAASGRKQLEIWSDKRLIEGHRLYRKFGAVLAGDRICDDPDQSPEWGLWMGLAT
jgi:putative acetyltransferase